MGLGNDLTPRLQEKTIRLLKDRPGWLTYEDIAQHTRLGRPWLEKLANGAIKDASANKIEILYRYLSDRTLEV